MPPAVSATRNEPIISFFMLFFVLDLFFAVAADVRRRSDARSARTVRLLTSAATGYRCRFCARFNAQFANSPPGNNHTARNPIIEAGIWLAERARTAAIEISSVSPAHKPSKHQH